jgi:hypothetical protein
MPPEFAAGVAGSTGATMRPQQFLAVFGDRHDQAKARDGFTRDVAGIGRVLPDRQARAGRPPGRDDFRIEPRFPRDLFDEIKHQRVRRVGQGWPP